MPDFTTPQATITGYAINREGVNSPGLIVGGPVALVRDDYVSNTSLKIETGVILEGAGPGATHVRGTNSTAIIEIIPADTGHTFSTLWEIAKMAIYNAGAGNAIRATVTNLQGILRQLVVGTAGSASPVDEFVGIGIDLPICERVRLDYISAMEDNYSNSIVRIQGGQMNTLQDFTCKGSVNANWISGRPILDISGNQCHMLGCSVLEPNFITGKHGYSLYMTGFGHKIDTLHIEQKNFGGGTFTDNRGAVFEDCEELSIDQLRLINNGSKMAFIGENSAFIRYMDFTGVSDRRFEDLIEWTPGETKLTIDQIMADYSIGSFNTRGIEIGSVIIKRSGVRQFFFNRKPYLDRNLVPTSNLWTVTMQGGATYSTVEQVGRNITVNVDNVGTAQPIKIRIPLEPTSVNPMRWQWVYTPPSGIEQAYTAFTVPDFTDISARSRESLDKGMLPDETITHIEVQLGFPLELGAWKLEEVAVYRELD